MKKGNPIRYSVDEGKTWSKPIMPMKKPKPKKQTLQQVLLCIHLKELGFETVTELQFCEGRRWRFDIACPNERLAFEVSGGNWTGGHKRGLEQESEYDKLNTAQMLGWRVLQYTNRQVTSGEAREFIRSQVCSASAATP